MKEANIVIVDEDADFCRRLDGCLRARLGFPVAVHDFTDTAPLGAYGEREETAALLISERVLEQAAIRGFPRVIVLTEGLGVEADAPVLRRVNKYRPLGGLIKEITELVLESASESGGFLTAGESRARLIGFFTPVSRCLQSTSALTLGQLSAQKKKTLCLSFEPFSGLSVFLPEAGDLSGLLYHYECEPEKLTLHVERMRTQIGALHMILPAETYMDVAETDAQRWREFFMRMAKETDYEIIVADLSVCVRGLPELLPMFDRIITIERDDAVSAEKLRRFERLMKRSGQEDLRAKSLRTTLPYFERLPADPARYAEGALADFFRKMIREEGLLGDDREGA